MLYAAIECHEEHGSKSETVVVDGALQATVTLRTPWEKRFELMFELLSPNAYPYPNTPTGWTQIWPTAITECVPDETKYTTDGDKQVIYYIDALVTVQYGYIDVGLVGIDPENPDIQARINEQLEPYAEFIRVNRDDVKWGSPTGASNPATGIPTLRTTALKEDEAPGKLYRGFNLVRQYYNIQTVHPSALTLPGTCNRFQYNSNLLGWIFPPETLLFNPPSMRRAITTAGSKGWNVTVKFNYKPQGWNQFWRAETNNWERMYRRDPNDGLWYEYYNYPLGDFRAWLQ